MPRLTMALQNCSIVDFHAVVVYWLKVWYCCATAGRKRCPISGRNLDRDWVVIEPDDELRARIHAWAERNRLDMDALEVAAYKLREPKNRMMRSLSHSTMIETSLSSSHSMPRQALPAFQQYCQQPHSKIRLHN